MNNLLFFLFFVFLINTYTTFALADSNNINNQTEQPTQASKNCAFFPMNNARMHDLFTRIEPGAEGQLGTWLIQHEN